MATITPNITTEGSLERDFSAVTVGIDILQQIVRAANLNPNDKILIVGSNNGPLGIFVRDALRRMGGSDREWQVSHRLMTPAHVDDTTGAWVRDAKEICLGVEVAEANENRLPPPRATEGFDAVFFTSNDPGVPADCDKLIQMFGAVTKVGGDEIVQTQAVERRFGSVSGRKVKQEVLLKEQAGDGTGKLSLSDTHQDPVMSVEDGDNRDHSTAGAPSDIPLYVGGETVSTGQLLREIATGDTQQHGDSPPPLVEAGHTPHKLDSSREQGPASSGEESSSAISTLALRNQDIRESSGAFASAGAKKRKAEALDADRQPTPSSNPSREAIAIAAKEDAEIDTYPADERNEVKVISKFEEWQMAVEAETKEKVAKRLKGMK